MKIFQSLLIVLTTILFLNCSNKAAKPTIQIEEGKIGMIGFGSLMSKTSMERTLRRKYKDSVYLVHLEGYQRAWNYYTPFNRDEDWFHVQAIDTIPIDNIIALNIMAAEGEKMNCALFFITPEELAQFDEREVGYNRVDVTDNIEEYAFKDGKVYAYKADKDHTYDGNNPNTFLPDGYLNLVTEACDSIGKSFRDEFEASTIPYDPKKVAKRENVFMKPRE